MYLRVMAVFLLLSSLLFSIPTVKIGILAKRSKEITLKKYTATADYLTQQVGGYRFEIVPLGFEELGKSVARGEIDFLLTNTAFYVELEHLYGVSRIATLKNISSDGKVVSSFGGVIFTSQKSSIRTLDDLRGKSFGAVDINSFGGWIMAQKELSDHGIVKDDFSEFRFLGSHDSVVLAVVNGSIDAGTVRTDTIERMVNEKIIAPDTLRIVDPRDYPGFPFAVSTELYPEWPFAKLPSTPQELSDKVLIALLMMSPETKAARDADIAGWTIPLDYSKVHTLLEVMGLSFYGNLKEFAFDEFYEKYKLWLWLFTALFFITVAVLLYIYRLNTRLKRAKIEIEGLNTGLEMKVQKRTVQLERMYSQERYLKELLRTITDINELLVSSFSKQTIVEESMHKFSRHKQYKLAWIGLIDGKMLEIVGTSDDHCDLLRDKSYFLDDREANPYIALAKECIRENHTMIEKINGSGCGDDSLLCHVIALPLRRNEYDLPIGVFCVYADSDKPFIDEEINMLENLATDISFALNAIEQRTVLEEMELARTANYEETILAFVNIIEQRDSYTAGHTLRVARYCRLIAEEMRIDESEIEKLEKAAILHDIGKVVTPDAILLKPGKLTALEYELIKQHSAAGYQMLSKIDMYKDLAEIIRFHHVHYDGNGYPQTDPARPDDVSILSYIMVVADAFDAMTSNRIYKSKKMITDAIRELERYSGAQFHPEVAKAAARVLKDIEIEDTSQLPSGEFEERRFAYFFRDSLTDVYNENYLKLILIKKDDDRRCYNLIELRNFSKYNHRFGWDQGNRFLKGLCEQLSISYPEAMIFRYQGDDFVLIFAQHRDVNSEDILAYDIFRGTDLSVDVTHHDLKDGIPKLK